MEDIFLSSSFFLWTAVSTLSPSFPTFIFFHFLLNLSNFFNFISLHFLFLYPPHFVLNILFLLFFFYFFTNAIYYRQRGKCDASWNRRKWTHRITTPHTCNICPILTLPPILNSLSPHPLSTNNYAFLKHSWSSSFIMWFSCYQKGFLPSRGKEKTEETCSFSPSPLLFSSWLSHVHSIKGQ